MGRIPCCEKDNVKRGQWTPEEDNKLSSYIAQHGTRNWRLIPKNAGLQRCGKSCRLRWTNYLRPDLKHGEFSDAEEQAILKLHSVVGNRWSLIAAQLPGRTDNDVKNYWNTKLKKKLSGMGIDPVTHKPFSHLMAEISSLAPPQVAHLAEAALGCFKDEMLHLLTKRRIDFNATNGKQEEKEDTNVAVEKIKMSLSRAMQMQEHEQLQLHRSSWETSNNFAGGCSVLGGGGFQYVPASMSSPWSQSMCSGSTCTAMAALQDKTEEENGEEDDVGKGSVRNRNTIFSTECVLWDIPSDDLINPIV